MRRSRGSRRRTDLEAVATADIVVEAVFEDIDVKSELFADLDRLAPRARSWPRTPRPSRSRDRRRDHPPRAVVGTHFFSPVPMMALCELVRGLQDLRRDAGRRPQFAEGIGKTCIVVNRDVAGFVTTRLITALVMEAMRLVESGVATR